MSVLSSTNKRFNKASANVLKSLVDFNARMNSRKRIKNLLKTCNIPKLTREEDAQVRQYFKSKGYTLKHTDWHAYYKALTGEFHNHYIPLGFFNTVLSPHLNQKLQWPALLDKNITYRLFDQFHQPKALIHNVNGFFYQDRDPIDLSKAVSLISKSSKQLVIKPSIDSGGGKEVVVFKVNDGFCTHKNLSIESLLKSYNKDFIVQEFLDQSEVMKSLNPTSLNTLRIMTYLNEKGVHIMATAARIGSLNSTTDNYKTGGVLCGLNPDGSFKSKGYTKKGEIFKESYTGIIFSNIKVPNYDLVIKMVKSMHKKIPYFRLVSWDIALNKEDKPVMIEYNTKNQGLEIQIVSGPLFKEFTDEILALGNN